MAQLSERELTAWHLAAELTKVVETLARANLSLQEQLDGCRATITDMTTMYVLGTIVVKACSYEQSPHIESAKRIALQDALHDVAIDIGEYF